MYVTLSSGNGASTVIAHENPGAAMIDTWTEQCIPREMFANQSIHLADVDDIAIGFGTKVGTTASSGSRTAYIDDIRLYRPEPQP